MRRHLGRPQRRSSRLPHYDYSHPGAYFITVRTYKKQLLFGDIVDGKMRLSSFGNIVSHCWQAIPMHFLNANLDRFVIMPNHLHGIIILQDNLRGAACCAPTKKTNVEGNRQINKPACGSLSAIVRSFKSAVTKRINEVRKTPGAPVWQRSFWDHIIRNEQDLNRIRQYILNNPLKWHLDRHNPDR